MKMFCYQCEQTAKGTGCTVGGVCGKSPETADLQDLLIHAVKGIGWHADRAARKGIRNAEVNEFVVQGLFTTITNVDFDPNRLEKLIRKAAVIKKKARKLAGETEGKEPAAGLLPSSPPTTGPVSPPSGAFSLFSLPTTGRPPRPDRRTTPPTASSPNWTGSSPITRPSPTTSARSSAGSSTTGITWSGCPTTQ